MWMASDSRLRNSGSVTAESIGVGSNSVRFAVMLQEYWKDGRPGGWPTGPLGQGVSICFMCADAITMYHDSRARGLKPARPFVGNSLWVTSFTDPDGYRLDFESPTDVPEETVYSDPK